MVYQELSLIPQRSVADNVFLGREPAGRFGTVDRKRLAARDAGAAGALPSGARSGGRGRGAQRRAAADGRDRPRALDRCPRADPGRADRGASLHEQDNLFAIIATLKAAGLLILYVSHRLDEIFRIADRVTVLRDGQKVATLATAATTQAELVRLMIGHELRERLPLPEVADQRPLLEVTLARRARPASFPVELRRGEILGLAGLVGAGRTGLARAIAGAGSPPTGPPSASTGRSAGSARRPRRSSAASST